MTLLFNTSLSLSLYDDWVTRHVTVRDLLCHRLGLERAQRLYYHRGYDQRELMRRMKYLKPAVGFRTGFNYANQQYGVAGLSSKRSLASHGTISSPKEFSTR